MRIICGFMVAVVLSAASVCGAAGKVSKAQELYQQGVELNKKGDYAGAIGYYTKALALKKNSAALYFVRGRAYRQNDQLELSEKDLSRAIALKPGYAEAYNHRGVTYVGLGKKKEALADFTKACRMGNIDACANEKKFNGTR